MWFSPDDANGTRGPKFVLAALVGWDAGTQAGPETLLLITLSLMAPPVQRAVSDKLCIPSDSLSTPPPVWTLWLLGDNDNVRPAAFSGWEVIRYQFCFVISILPLKRTLLNKKNLCF